MDQLQRLLNFLEKRIDLEHIQRIEALNLKTVRYEPVPVLPLSIRLNLNPSGFTPCPYQAAYDDPEKMLFNELLSSHGSIYHSVVLQDDFPLHIRSNHGVGIIASLFGANCRIINDNMPWVDPLESLDEIKALIAKGIPDFDRGLGAKVIETHQFYLETLQKYPRCFQAIHVTQPDLQGPFDIAHLLAGPDIFYHLFDEPEVIHELLDLITETYIGYRLRLELWLTHAAGGEAVFVHGGVYGGKVVIKDDTAAVNLSETMYNEFSRQYNERIFRAFGGGSLHHCGKGRKWHFDSFYSPWLKGLNLGNPESHSLENLYGIWSQVQVPLLGWGYNQGSDFLEEVYRLKIPTGVTLAVKADDYDEARRIIHRHRESGMAELA